jgi:hypothetical protein
MVVGRPVEEPQSILGTWVISLLSSVWNSPP